MTNERVLRLLRLESMGITGWARYRVLAGDGAPLGYVLEHRDWMGWRHGGRRWYSAHKVDEEARVACWVSDKLRSRTAAVEALRAHLEGCGG